MRIHGSFAASTQITPAAAPTEQTPRISLREKLEREARGPEYASRIVDQNPTFVGKPAGWNAMPRWENGIP